MTRWLIFGSVDPQILGPYKTDDDRDIIALDYGARYGQQELIAQLDIENEQPKIVAYSKEFFEYVYGVRRTKVKMSSDAPAEVLAYLKGENGVRSDKAVDQVAEA